MLLSSPDRAIQLSTKRKRDVSGTEGGAAGGTAWPKPSVEAEDAGKLVAITNAVADGVGSSGEGGLHNGESVERGATDTVGEQDGEALGKKPRVAIAPPPSLARSKSHLKRPESLALHDLEVPQQPEGVPPPPPGVEKEGCTAGSRSEEGGELQELDVPLVDVMNTLSPLLASSLGLPPESMRSFLRIDELTFDLLSPLGSTRRNDVGIEAFEKPAP